MRVVARSESCSWKPPRSERAARAIASEVLEQCLALALGRARREIEREYDRWLRSHRLTTCQMRMLSAILLRGPIRHGELAQMFGTRVPTVSNTVRRMFAK